MIKVTSQQRGALTNLMGDMRSPAPLVRRANVILQASAGVVEEQIAKRVGLEIDEVEEAIFVWGKGAESLAEAEKAGTRILREKVRKVLDSLTDFGSDCDCGCDDEETMKRTLNDQQIAQLAGKVYDLLRYELRIERERLAYGRF